MRGKRPCEGLVQWLAAQLAIRTVQVERWCYQQC